MKVAQVNMLSTGSTGKIMLQIAECARQKDITALTYSTYPLLRGIKKSSQVIQGHKYTGSFLENAIHFLLSRFFGGNGLHSRIGTRQLIKELKKENVDVLHLHNLHASCYNLPMLFEFIKKHKIRVIWTLHDCWAFTGHCAHFDYINCEKWKNGCFKCPQKMAYPKSHVDDSNAMYKRKQEWFTAVKDLTIVTPSNWLADLVKQSFLKDYPVQVIHNGIDLSVFQPTESNFREKYAIKDKYIVLGVAFGWGKRKGLDVFIELAKRLGEQYQIVLVGTDKKVDKQLPANIISIHRTQNQQELAEIYTEADVFANPTREEVLGLVNIEALACGTPVVTFDSGGSPECIDETCGVVVDKDDIDDMEREIKRICIEKPFTKEVCLERANNFDSQEKFNEYILCYNKQIKTEEGE